MGLLCLCAPQSEGEAYRAGRLRIPVGSTQEWVQLQCQNIVAGGLRGSITGRRFRSVPSLKERVQKKGSFCTVGTFAIGEPKKAVLHG